MGWGDGKFTSAHFCTQSMHKPIRVAHVCDTDACCHRSLHLVYTHNDACSSYGALKKATFAMHVVKMFHRSFHVVYTHTDLCSSYCAFRGTTLCMIYPEHAFHISQKHIYVLFSSPQTKLVTLFVFIANRHWMMHRRCIKQTHILNSSTYKRICIRTISQSGVAAVSLFAA